jgi:hypothetical protein
MCLAAGCTTKGAPVRVEVSAATSVATNDGGADIWVTAVIANFDSSPLDTQDTEFTLDTTHGTFEPSPFTGPEPCSPQQVTSGSDATCVVVFEIPPGAAPTELAYGSATGPMPAAKPLMNACTQLYGWIDSANPSCAQCASQALDGDCYEQVETYSESCGCWSPGDTSNDTCAFEAVCDPSDCQERFQTFEQCVANDCSDSCNNGN